MTTALHPGSLPFALVSGAGVALRTPACSFAPRPSFVRR
ncbi:hypothetical protein RHIZO_03984 [Rhizobiaceae bacterium]|nr:hypothetical protein RHIZO_03984 [Rhizobiaceae bacterium]